MGYGPRVGKILRRAAREDRGGGKGTWRWIVNHSLCRGLQCFIVGHGCRWALVEGIFVAVAVLGQVVVCR